MRYKTVDSGQWTVDSGQWTVDSGQWTVSVICQSCQWLKSTRVLTQIDDVVYIEHPHSYVCETHRHMRERDRNSYTPLTCTCVVCGVRVCAVRELASPSSTDTDT